MPKAIAIDTLRPELGLLERFGIAKRAGFDFIELGDWTTLDLNQVKAGMVANGLRLSRMAGDSGNAYNPYEGRDFFLEHLSQTLAVAKSLACPNLGLRLAIGKPGATGLLLEGVRQAAKAGRTLLLDPAGAPLAADEHLQASAQAGDAIDAFKSPNLKLLFRLRRDLLVGAALAATTGALRKHCARIGYIQVEMGAGDGADPQVRQGLRALRTLLRDQLDYDGFVGFSLLPGARDDAGLMAVWEEWV